MESLLILTGLAVTGYRLSLDNRQNAKNRKKLTQKLSKNEEPNETSVYASSKLKRAKEDQQQRADKIYPEYISKITGSQKLPANHLDLQENFTPQEMFHTNMEPHFSGSVKLTELKNLDSKYQLFTGQPQLLKSQVQQEERINFQPDAKEIYDVNKASKDRMILNRNKLVETLPENEIDKPLVNLRVNNFDPDTYRLYKPLEAETIIKHGQKLNHTHNVSLGETPFKSHRHPEDKSLGILTSGASTSRYTESPRGDIVERRAERDFEVGMRSGAYFAKTMHRNGEYDRALKYEVDIPHQMNRAGASNSTRGSYHKSSEYTRPTLKSIVDKQVEHSPIQDNQNKSGGYLLSKIDDRPINKPDMKQRMANAGSSHSTSFPTRDHAYTTELNDRISQVPSIQRPTLHEQSGERLKTEHDLTRNVEYSHFDRLDYNTLFKQHESEPTFIGNIMKKPTCD